MGNRTTNRGGFTLLEMMISVTVLAVLARVLIGASEAASDMTSAGNLQSVLLRDSERAMKAILEDLRMSGFQTVDGLDYPYVFDEGAPDAAFAAYAFAPPPRAAVAGDADFGVLRTIVLALPSDLDGDGRPELDADANGVPELDGNGDGVPTDSAADTAGLWDPALASIHPTTRLVWSHADVGYVVTAGPTGENELVRLVDGGAGGRTVLARGIERVQFDTPASSGFTIPSGTVRVRIFFRVPDAEGHIYRSRIEATVRLRNS